MSVRSRSNRGSVLDVLLGSQARGPLRAGRNRSRLPWHGGRVLSPVANALCRRPRWRCLRCRGRRLAKHRGGTVVDCWSKVDVWHVEAGRIVGIRISTADRLQNTRAGSVHKRLLKLVGQLVAKLEMHRWLRRKEAVILSSRLGSIMINNIVGSDTLVFVVIRARSHGQRFALRVSLSISGRAAIWVGGCMRRRQRTLALISISCGRPVVILVVRVRRSLAIRRWLSLVGSVGVASWRAVTVLVTVMAVVTRWRIQGMSRSVLVGVKGVAVAAVNRDRWWGRGVIGFFIVFI